MPLGFGEIRSTNQLYNNAYSAISQLDHGKKLESDGRTFSISAIKYGNPLYRNLWRGRSSTDYISAQNDFSIVRSVNRSAIAFLSKLETNLSGSGGYNIDEIISLHEQLNKLRSSIRTAKAAERFFPPRPSARVEKLLKQREAATGPQKISQEVEQFETTLKTTAEIQGEFSTILNQVNQDIKILDEILTKHSNTQVEMEVFAPPPPTAAAQKERKQKVNIQSSANRALAQLSRRSDELTEFITSRACQRKTVQEGCFKVIYSHAPELIESYDAFCKTNDISHFSQALKDINRTHFNVAGNLFGLSDPDRKSNLAAAEALYESMVKLTGSTEVAQKMILCCPQAYDSRMFFQLADMYANLPMGLNIADGARYNRDLYSKQYRIYKDPETDHNMLEMTSFFAYGDYRTNTVAPSGVIRSRCLVDFDTDTETTTWTRVCPVGSDAQPPGIDQFDEADLLDHLLRDASAKTSAPPPSPDAQKKEKEEAESTDHLRNLGLED